MYFETLQDWLSWQEGFHPLAIDLGLERADHVFTALNPHKIKPLTITIAGTNGKGSCVAYLEAIYLAQGYRVGAYTSPHILKYNERIKINGQPVSDAAICEAFARIEAVRADHSLSYFEFGTLAALDLFWRADLDIQLLEVGLGGRLDVVNVVEPDVALVSSIGIDHVAWLGDSRDAIGREKAGIFRAGVPAIVGDPYPPSTVLETAAEKKAQLFCIGNDFGYHKYADHWEWYAGQQALKYLPMPALKGEHQYRNAASIILAIQCLQYRLPVEPSAIAYGLRYVQLAGRFQLIEGDIPVLLDVGHNPEAVLTLVDYLSTYFAGKRVHAVFSMMKDKDIVSVLNIMKPVIQNWFFAPLTNSRATTELAMREFFLQVAIPHVFFGYTDFADAFDAARNQAQPVDLIIVFGSFFLVSDCLNEFEHRELIK